MPAIIGALFRWSPYIGLAFIAADVFVLVQYGGSVLLVSLTVLKFWSASSDAPGGVTAFYTLPTQWLLALLTASGPKARRAT